MISISVTRTQPCNRLFLLLSVPFWTVGLLGRRRDGWRKRTGGHEPCKAAARGECPEGPRLALDQ